jgi:ATP-binding cassette subfamily C (CFTR/MRP) protein 1
VVSTPMIIQHPRRADHGHRTIFDPLNSHPPTPPAFSMDEATDIPLATASFISKLTFWWMTPLLLLGYKRSLVAEDLWKMDESRRAAHLADLFEGHFARRKGEVEEWNRCIDEGTMEITWARRTWWRTYHQVTGFGSPDGRRTVGMGQSPSPSTL